MSVRYLARGMVASIILLFAVSGPIMASTLESAINKGVKRSEQAQAAQRKIDDIDATTRDIEREYRGALKQVEGLNVYIEQLNKQLNAQGTELNEIEESIRQVTIIERQVSPLMLRMIEALGVFVEADVPFLYDSRSERVNKLSIMMGRSDVTIAEKYRKVMAAYQTEMDYGRTIEAYRGELTLGNDTREVDFLRTGRVAFVYQTLDGKDIGVWNNTSRAWQVLDSKYKSKVLMAIRIAREQAAPSLIQMPVVAASELTK